MTKNQLKDMKVVASSEQEIKSGDTGGGRGILAPLNSISNNMHNHKNHIKFIRGETMAQRRRGQGPRALEAKFPFRSIIQFRK